jgi:hypothetical protein
MTLGNGSPLYLVVEGNRRVASVKILLKDQEAGAANIQASVLTTLQSLPVIEIVGTGDERESYRHTLMAIRHISGIREWGPYQQVRRENVILCLHDHMALVPAIGPAPKGRSGSV